MPIPWSTPPKFLSADQHAAIAEHLRTEISWDRIDVAIATIDVAYGCAIWFIVMDELHPGEGRQIQRRKYRHFSQLAKHLAAIEHLLTLERPRSLGLATFDWAAFNEALATVLNSTRDEIRARTLHQRGRPPLEWRDDLVAAVFSVYPPGAATRRTVGRCLEQTAAMLTVGSHFEQTVAMVLEYLNHDVENVHDVIVRALTRRSDPPFRIQLRRHSVRQAGAHRIASP